MSSDLSTGSLAASVEQTLTRLPKGPREEVVDAPPPLVQPDGPEFERGTVLHPTTVRSSGSTGLRIRLLIADVAATAGTWFLLGAIIDARYDRQSSVGCGACGHRRDAWPQCSSLGCIDRGCASSVGRSGRGSSSRSSPARSLSSCSGVGGIVARRGRRRCRVLHPRPDGLPVDVHPVAAGATSARTPPPRARHDRDQRRCGRRADNA